MVSNCSATQKNCVVGDNNGDIRLQENYPGQKARYLALSHCWGTDHSPPKTTHETISSSRHKTPWWSLSKTFKDAIELTRELGIQHVWIDSLCIIQDDTDDWVRESSSMASIYANSFLTIAATGSEDGRGGLFRNPLAVERFTMLDSDGIPTTLYAREDEVGEHLPLMKRGWAFQERYLSPRLIHFTPTELVWECKTSCTCECGRLEESSYGLRNHKWYYRIGTLQGVFGTGHRNTWPTIIRLYSDCQLTKMEDKLPALSGLAQETRKRCLSSTVNPGRYLAGLWESGLLYQLHWIQESYVAPIRCGTVAPSWSWASVTGRISLPSFTEAGNLFEASITSSHCSTSTDDPYGQVSGGFLNLSTVLIRVKVPLLEGYFTYSTAYRQVTMYREYLEEEGHLRLYVRFDTRTEWQSHIIRRQNGLNKSLFVHGAVLSYHPERVVMLLLDEVPGPGRNFRRVGIAIGRSGEVDTVQVEKLLQRPLSHFRII